MKLLSSLSVRLGKLLKNFYFISTALFLCFVLYIDSNDLFTQLRLEQQVRRLEGERTRLKSKITSLEKQNLELYRDTVLLERIARERYLLRRADEDLYIVEKRLHSNKREGRE